MDSWCNKEYDKYFKEQDIKSLQNALIDLDQSAINTYTNLIDVLEIFIKTLVAKKDYSEESEACVICALKVMKICRKKIKDYQKDLLLLAEHPVGSRKRPRVAIMKGDNEKHI